MQPQKCWIYLGQRRKYVIYIKVTKVTEDAINLSYTNYRNGGARMQKRACVDQKLCVACGCCMNACKIGAISIPNGVCAIIDEVKCVGCGMGAKNCPASVIAMEVVQDA